MTRLRTRVAVLALGVAITSPLHAQRQKVSPWNHADSAIVRLAPSAFLTLPVSVRVALTSRGCLIPQSPEVPKLHNVDGGHLRGNSGIDWVALCSIAGRSRILVFWGGDTTQVDSLSASADRNFLQGMGGGSIAFSRIIGIVDARFIRQHAAWYGGALPPGAIHDGINDAFAGKGSTVYYWSAGRWLELAGAD